MVLKIIMFFQAVTDIRFQFLSNIHAMLI